MSPTQTEHPEFFAALRAPFPAGVVGKLPRVWCGACKDVRPRTCPAHQRKRCQVCGNTLTEAHKHLDYIGHAQVTDRLLAVDPCWTWDPVAFDAAGLPALDRHGGLWILLTVGEVTRYGYGHADGKSGPDAVKEAIGDALRNAAMRFGVGLDLWGATPVNGDTVDDESDDQAPANGESVDQAPASDADIRRRREQAVVDKATEAGYADRQLLDDLVQRFDSTATTVDELLAALTDDQLRERYQHYKDLAAHRAETAGQVAGG